MALLSHIKKELPTSKSILSIKNSKKASSISQDSGAQYGAQKLVTLFIGRFFPILFVFVVFASPLYAHASVFSFISNLFSQKETTPAVRSFETSEPVKLLSATGSVDPAGPRGGGDITVVSGAALLPETGPSGTIADVEETQVHGQVSVYIVRSGDTLSDIAKMFDVSIATIIWANDDLKNSSLKPGQRLVILPVSGIRHVVVKGDTVEKLATKYKADKDEIIQFNEIKGDLVIGDTVIVPDAELQAPVIAGKTPQVRGSSAPNYVGYYIRPIVGGRKTQGLHGYNGIDIGAPIGTPVIASATGDVILSRNYGWNGGYGNYIIIEHPNGTHTLYSHLSANIVFEGYHVVKGQTIGYVGQTGKVTGPHLHFEIRGAKNPF